MTTSPPPDFSPVLHVGPQALAAADIVPLLRRYGLLPALAKELIIDQATAAVALTPEQAAQAVDQFLQINQIASPEQRQSFLTQRGLSEADLAFLGERTQKLKQYKRDTWGPQVESYFLQRKSHLDRVLYSLVRTREAGLAQELFFRIQDDGQPFADLARQYSEGQEAQTGGLIGPVELSVPHPALSRILVMSQPGQLWPPTRVGEWFVVVRLEKFLPARLDDTTRQRLIDELFNTWLQEQVQTTLKDNSLVETETE
ncbi:peptidylprolyl isomerase [Nodosilinea sp. LEGE 07298]|uniref:peptidylprolyl isomerase n=1 Tax=Nodosilinea sp. LEGE 07298 TaxID=2777970 RepID=UPI00188008C3|nr:peptidylprolyl isomerase [Nodosilinea sp. LEGE 07298]MBE9113043.1 peptidylprolyl isomerase [Nodosilinea sp. LEGE 07298]